MAAMGGLTAYVLDEQRKRKQAESQQKAEVEQRAARFNVEQEQRRAEALEEQQKKAEIEAYWAGRKLLPEIATEEAAGLAIDPDQPPASPKQDARMKRGSVLATGTATAVATATVTQTPTPTTTGTTDLSTVAGIRIALQPYGVVLTGNGWTVFSATAVYNGVMAVGTKMASVRNLKETPTEAFKTVYGTATTPLHFMWGNTSDLYFDDGSGYYRDDLGNLQPKTCEISIGGCNVGSSKLKSDRSSIRLIKFASMSDNSQSAINNVVHELGHLFDAVNNTTPRSDLNNAIRDNQDATPEVLDDLDDWLRRPDTAGYYGFASRRFPWQQATVNVGESYEIFADQFLAWVFDAWETDINGELTESAQARSTWMDQNMGSWLAYGD
ncbi:MAG: hypothetical protein FJZ96_11200 [Chloroflexi bacterium]|nr:hypothetical protein [Chloroflexota bacterium]